jgi:hypothetical protein
LCLRVPLDQVPDLYVRCHSLPCLIAV